MHPKEKQHIDFVVKLGPRLMKTWSDGGAAIKGVDKKQHLKKRKAAKAARKRNRG